MSPTEAVIEVMRIGVAFGQWVVILHGLGGIRKGMMKILSAPLSKQR
jgi:hypothetical protein